MVEQEILYSREDGLGMVTLNRPEKLNALTHPMLERLHSIIEEIRRDDSVRVAILTGNGRSFCAGTDITGEVPVTSEVEIITKEAIC
jgi:enoyl-CoA hydratase/carnithine racemase